MKNGPLLEWRSRLGIPQETDLSAAVCRQFYTKKFKKVTHCIFDLDGTILDSEIIYHEVIREICKKFNKIYTNKLQDRLHGASDHELSTTVIRELKLPISAHEFEIRLHNSVEKSLPKAPLKDGIERLLKHLQNYNIPMALATNSKEHTLRLHCLARPKLFQIFHHMVSANDPEVKRSKPHPDLHLLAASRFPDKPKPFQCLVFEDSVVGIEAARQAGMQSVMIPEQGIDLEQTHRATLVLRSLLHFEPHAFGLPPFDICQRPACTRTSRRVDII